MTDAAERSSSASYSLSRCAIRDCRLRFALIESDFVLIKFDKIFDPHNPEEWGEILVSCCVLCRVTKLMGSLPEDMRPLMLYLGGAERTKSPGGGYC